MTSVSTEPVPPTDSELDAWERDCAAGMLSTSATARLIAEVRRLRQHLADVLRREIAAHDRNLGLVQRIVELEAKPESTAGLVHRLR